MGLVGVGMIFKERAARKILVIAEDDGTVRPKTIEELFDGVEAFIF